MNTAANPAVDTSSAILSDEARVLAFLLGEADATEQTAVAALLDASPALRTWRDQAAAVLPVLLEALRLTEPAPLRMDAVRRADLLEKLMRKNASEVPEPKPRQQPQSSSNVLPWQAFLRKRWIPLSACAVLAAGVIVFGVGLWMTKIGGSGSYSDWQSEPETFVIASGDAALSSASASDEDASPDPVREKIINNSDADRSRDAEFSFKSKPRTPSNIARTRVSRPASEEILATHPVPPATAPTFPPPAPAAASVPEAPPAFSAPVVASAAPEKMVPLRLELPSVDIVGTPSPIRINNLEQESGGTSVSIYTPPASSHRDSIVLSESISSNSGTWRLGASDSSDGIKLVNDGLTVSGRIEANDSSTTTVNGSLQGAYRSTTSTGERYRGNAVSEYSEVYSKNNGTSSAVSVAAAPAREQANSAVTFSGDLKADATGELKEIVTSYKGLSFSGSASGGLGGGSGGGIGTGVGSGRGHFRSEKDQLPGGSSREPIITSSGGSVRPFIGDEEGSRHSGRISPSGSRVSPVSGEISAEDYSSGRLYKRSAVVGTDSPQLPTKETPRITKDGKNVSTDWKQKSTPRVFTPAAENAFSTFSLNVSDASFRLAAEALRQGRWPDPATLRTEEFVNALAYGDPPPAPGEPVSLAQEQARDPFTHNRNFLRLSLQTASAGRTARQALNLTLLLDTSGSMERADRQATAAAALRALAGHLGDGDSVSLIGFALNPRLIFRARGSAAKETLLKSIGTIPPEGGTNLEKALQAAYEQNWATRSAGSQNRVVLLTDGAANLGDANPGSLARLIEQNKKRGITLDCFGIGFDDYNDAMLETLARAAHGRYAYLNNAADAREDFAKKLAGALQVAAQNVKVQVEFNPARVTSWRLLGYEKHLLKKEEFRDNTVLAAQLGAAESGTAVYSVEMNPDGTGGVGVLRVRYQDPRTGEYHERDWAIPFEPTTPALERAASGVKLAAVAALFAERLDGGGAAAPIQLKELVALVRSAVSALGEAPANRRLQEMLEAAQRLE